MLLGCPQNAYTNTVYLGHSVVLHAKKEVVFNHAVIYLVDIDNITPGHLDSPTTNAYCTSTRKEWDITQVVEYQPVKIDPA